jgi:hypothetical protein
VTAAAQPQPSPASATDSLAAVAEAALANLEDLPAGMSGLARSNRPASPTERRDAIAQAWRDEPGITDTALAERFGVSGRTIQRDTQTLQERGIQRWAAGQGRWPRRRGIIVGVAAARMQRPASTCPPRRPPRAGRQPARLPAAGTPAGDHLSQTV